MEANYASSINTERDSSSNRKRAAIVHPPNSGEAIVFVENYKRLKAEVSEFQLRRETADYAVLSSELDGWPLIFPALDAFNFQKSGLLSRFMFYDLGEWKDVSKDANITLAESFRARRSSSVLIMGGKNYLVDFVRMVQMNMQTGYLRSVAWIDVRGKCYFPSKCIEGTWEMQLLRDYSGQHLGLSSFCDDSAQSTCTEATNVIGPVSSAEEATQTSESTLNSGVGEEASKCTDSADVHARSFTLLHDTVIKLDEADQEFKAVEKMFFAGLGFLATHATTCAIFRDCYKSTSGQARLLAFKRQEEITRKARGDANIRYAWHGTSKQGVSGIVLHGFGQPKIPKNGAMYGIGVYLAPEGYSHVSQLVIDMINHIGSPFSAVYSDVDENGVQHMVLCQAILGNMEQIAPGSEQFHPSSEDHDTGVDDINNPKRYIIWSTHMNTHILPQYIVSFKLDPQWRDVIAALRGKQSTDKRPVLGRVGQWGCEGSSRVVTTKDVHGELPMGRLGKESAKKVPRSPWMSFPMLFLVLKRKLSGDKMGILEKYYLEFKYGRLSRDSLIKLVRLVAGDKLLADSIRSMQAQEKVNGPTEAMSHVGESDIILPSIPLNTVMPSLDACEAGD